MRVRSIQMKNLLWSIRSTYKLDERLFKNLAGQDTVSLCVLPWFFNVFFLLRIFFLEFDSIDRLLITYTYEIDFIFKSKRSSQSNYVFLLKFIIEMHIFFTLLHFIGVKYASTGTTKSHAQQRTIDQNHLRTISM